MANEVRYARSGDVHIAYRVFGDGPRDVVLIPGTLSHAEIYWDFPVNQYSLKRFTSFARVIVFTSAARGSPIASASRLWRSASATCGP